MRRVRVAICGLVVLSLAAGMINSDTPHPRDTPGLGGLADSLRDFFRVPPKAPESEPLALRDLPRKQVAPTGAEAKPATRVRELEDKRTERTRQFELSDGRVQAEISAAPLNYRDAGGRMRPIDTKLKPGSGGVSFANATNTFGTSFGVGTARLSTFDLGGRRISIGVDGPQRELRPTAKGSAVRFPDAFGPGADVRLGGAIAWLGLTAATVPPELQTLLDEMPMPATDELLRQLPWVWWLTFHEGALASWWRDLPTDCEP